MSGLTDAELIARARRIPSDPNATVLGAGLTLIAMADRLEALEAELAALQESADRQTNIANHWQRMCVTLEAQLMGIHNPEPIATAFTQIRVAELEAELARWRVVCGHKDILSAVKYDRRLIEHAHALRRKPSNFLSAHDAFLTLVKPEA